LTGTAGKVDIPQERLHGVMSVRCGDDFAKVSTANSAMLFQPQRQVINEVPLLVRELWFEHISGDILAGISEPSRSIAMIGAISQ
tara:strand:+ start:149 stop:403 length:255 start_codon:yes stop_codon:yes gene_type:complete